MSKITGHIYKFFSRFKFHIVIILGVLIVGVLDENSFMKRIEYAYQIEDLKTEIQKYNNQYQHDMQHLKELKTDPKAVARVARERYFMKADNEDIFVLSDDEHQTENTAKNETTE
ncbi:FtsB family cell division protein [Prevotella sp.]|nr:septum formation initiator family protein [uncultured Prevotella sp.]